MHLTGKTVLVTGAAGFIGSHLAERLAALGCRTRGLVRYNSTGAAGWLDASPLRNEIEIVPGDVRDLDTVRKAVQDADVVFHLAALIGIPYSYAAPLSYVRTNVEGTLNVLEAAREAGVERIVHTSTSEVYGTARTVPISEAHPLQAQSPYSATKIAADKLAQSFQLSFGAPVVIVRPFNTYGPRQSARAVVPTIVAQVLSGKPVRLGSLTPTRDFNYVADTVEGFLACAQADAAVGEVVNLGTGSEISIADLACEIMVIIGRTVPVEQDPARVRPQQSEVERLCADVSNAQRLTGWVARHTLRDGLTKTIEWLQAHERVHRPTVYQT